MCCYSQGLEEAFSSHKVTLDEVVICGEELRETGAEDVIEDSLRRLNDRWDDLYLRVTEADLCPTAPDEYREHLENLSQHIAQIYDILQSPGTKSPLARVSDLF